MIFIHERPRLRKRSVISNFDSEPAFEVTFNVPESKATRIQTWSSLRITNGSILRALETACQGQQENGPFPDSFFVEHTVAIVGCHCRVRFDYMARIQAGQTLVSRSVSLVRINLIIARFGKVLHLRQTTD